MNTPVIVLDAKRAIPDAQFVIPDSLFVIPDLIRDPVPRRYWIADQARNDSWRPQ